VLQDVVGSVRELSSVLHIRTRGSATVPIVAMEGLLLEGAYYEMRCCGDTGWTHPVGDLLLNCPSFSLLRVGENPHYAAQIVRHNLAYS
jgi:hypothetical protein